MKIAVFGLWHLGSVTAACLARRGFDVTGVDLDVKTVRDLSEGKAPLFEPGLDDLLAQGLASKKLRFSHDLKAVHDADLVWIAFDTPVDPNDHADIPFLKKRMERLFAAMNPRTPILFSSQVPVGFARSLIASFNRLRPGEEFIYCYSPENLRLGNAIDSFDKPARIIAGTSRPENREIFKPLLSAICPQIEWMTIESAEMVKHAINSFLAASIAFTNELAALCEASGADARDVERGLKTEPRIGPKAYVKAGAAFAGGTLARDLHFLVAQAKISKQPAYVLKAVLKSNEFHKTWAQRQIQKHVRPLKGCRVTVLGLSYKAGTDTTRRSWAIELCQWLSSRGAQVTAYDSAIRTLKGTASSSRIKLAASHEEALRKADVVVVGTDDPVFKTLDPLLFQTTARCLVLDANGVLRALMDRGMNITYVTVGHGAHR